MDVGPFASIAQIRILLVPVGSIRRSAFEKYAGLVRSFDHIRLGDIPPDAREDKNRFLPSPLASGHLHLSFLTNPPPTWRSVFNLFRVSSFPLGVIGIADCTSDTTASSIVAEYKANMSILFPDGSPFPFATRCFAFEDGEGNANMNLSASVQDLVMIPSLMANKQIYVGTLLAELCHDIIIEFPSIVRCIDTPHGLDILNSEILPRLGQMGGVYYLHKSAETPAELTRSGSQRSGTPSSNRGANGVRSGSGTPPIRLAVGSSLKKRNSALGPSGRLAKVLGDLYLISGKLSDANFWFTEAIAFFRIAQDTIWNASALEGQCAVELLEAWNLGDSLHASIGGNALGYPWANISDKMGQAINLYSRATPTNPSTSNAAPSNTETPSIVFLYVSAVLRHAHLLFCIWSSKGWNPLSLSLTFSMSLPPTFTPEKPSIAALHRMSALSNITRSSIAQIITQCHGPFLLHLQPSDRIFAYSVMAKLYSFLGFRRKEVYVLRELQAAVVDLIILGREETRSEFSEPTPSYTSHIEIDRDDLTEPPGHGGSVARRDQENEEGNSSVLRMTRHIAAVYGVDLEAVKLGIESEVEKGSRENADLPQPSLPEVSRAVPYGWPELQVGVVREALAVAEALPDHVSKIQISQSTIRQLHQHLTPNEQQHLYDTAIRGLNIVRRRGGRERPEFWPHNLIISLIVIPLPSHRRPIKQSRNKLGESEAVPSAIPGPFIYDPKGKRTNTAPVAVQNETVEFEVNLRNPYLFDLDIQSILLSTTGSEFQTQPRSVVIPADSDITVVLSGVPLEARTVTIRGCHLQLVGGMPKEILVPLSDNDGVRLSVQKASSPDNDSDRIKYTGLESNLLISPRGEMAYKLKRASQARIPGFREVHVVPEQPLLRLQRSSVVHGSLMLFSGERSTVQLTVENISTLPVGFLKLTFEDSTMASARRSLDEGELSVAEAYETEFELLQRPFLSWDPSDERRVIPPGEKLAIRIACYGKLDCSVGTVNLSYGCINCHGSDDLSTEDVSLLPDTFHLRQMQYPINVTVYRTLECDHLDIIPLRTFHSLPSLGEHAPEEDLARRRLLEVGKPGEYCLISLDITNVFGMPFNATLRRRQADAPDASMTRVVPPGSTVRLFLPIKRFSLSSEHSSVPLPTLSDRQFVVSKEQLSQEEERLQRELFWYREELFKIVDATWTEDATHRSGIISLRSQRLTLSMCEAMRQPCFFIEPRFETVCTEGGGVDAGSNFSEGASFTRPLASHGQNTWRVEVCEMVYLVIRVRNDLDRACRLSLTCRSIHPTPSEYAIFDGRLSNNHLGVFQPGQSTTKTFTVVFVAEGTFSFSVDVEELDLETGSPLRGLGRYPATSSESVIAIVEESGDVQGWK